MSNSVVPAAAAAHAKQLVRNKKLVKRTEDQQPARDEQQAADKDDDAAHAIQAKQAEHLQHSMSDSTLSADFSFAGALSAAADSASLAESSAQDEGGSTSDDGDGVGGTVLLVAGVGLVGLGVAVAAGGGGNKNEAPDITSGSTATVAENAAITTVVYTTVASDPDGDALTYTLTGTDAAAFAISTAGVVTLKASADFETKASYTFNVVATDPDGLSDTQAVTVTVTNVPSPAFTSGSTAAIAENAAVTTVVYDANVSGTAPATFALTGTDAAAFNIDSATGVVTLKTSADFETKSSYSIGVIATQGGETATQNVAVSVTDVTGAGDPPVFTSGTSATIAENSATSTVVYDANTTGTGATFALTGSDASFFTIDADDGEVRFKTSPDFETKTSYNIGVVATQGGASTTRDVAVSVTNVTETPTFSSATTASIPENSPISTVVYDANVTGTAATTFALSGADASAFTIDADDGEVRFKASPDFETKSTYNISVIASSGGESKSQAVTVSVTDVNPEGPVFSSAATASINENSPISTVVYDANVTGTVATTFALTGADASAFTIDADDGEVRFKVSPDFETKSSYAISVTATNAQGSTTQAVAVSINNVDPEGPVIKVTNIDGLGNPTAENGALAINAGADNNEFREGNGATFVRISNFTANDKIVLLDTDDIGDYNFATGTGADKTDLIINRTVTGGIASIIVLEDVLTNTKIFDYESARLSVGHDFITLG